MAGFKTHIATSTVLGIGYGAVAHSSYGVAPDQCLLAAGMCSVAGMLPDLDSDNSVPAREVLAFAAAVAPMLMIERFREAGLTTDAIVLAAGLLYILIRFGVGWLLHSYTRHRGMFHSLPAAVIFTELAYLACDCHEPSIRLFKAMGVFFGFMSHLILDEIWAVQFRGGVRLKNSFGTALKLWDHKTWWPNISTYGKLILLSAILMNPPGWMQPSEKPRLVDQKRPSPMPTRQADFPPPPPPKLFR